MSDTMQIIGRIKATLLMWGLVGSGLSMAAGEPILTPVQKLETGVVSWVSHQQGQKLGDVSMQPLDPRLKVQSCSQELKFDFPFSSTETVRVRCGQPAWQLFVRVTLAGAPATHVKATAGEAVSAASALRQVWVVDQHLSAGSPVSKGRLRLVDKEASAVGPMALDPSTDLTHMEAVRDLPPGTVVRQYDLKHATLIKRGQMVQILMGQGQGFQIAARVEALQDGRFGEQIKLKNPESGRILSGVVRGPGTVAGS